jgi:hypothetical protein
MILFYDIILKMALEKYIETGVITKEITFDVCSSKKKKIILNILRINQNIHSSMSFWHSFRT